MDAARSVVTFPAALLESTVDDTRAQRIEAFNLFNPVNYGTPKRFVNTPQFGTITEAATPARQIQFVVRATF